MINDMPEIAQFMLRVTFGFLTFMHGVGKLRSVSGFAAKWDLSLPVAWIVCATQLAGGALIFAGLFTQIAALVQVGLNLVILYLLIFRKKEAFLVPGQHSWSIGLIYVVMAAAIALGGHGAWALDQLIR